MNAAEAEAKVKAMIGEIYNRDPPDIVDEARLEPFEPAFANIRLVPNRAEPTGPDLGGDSLDRVELTMALEDEFLLEISDDEAEALNTVKDCVELIVGKLEAREVAENRDG